jgi:hypothetical protein
MTQNRCLKRLIEPARVMGTKRCKPLELAGDVLTVHLRAASRIVSFTTGGAVH